MANAKNKKGHKRTRAQAHKSTRVAFTLVELLITTTILGIISVAIVANFAGALKIYERVRNYTGIRPDALLSLEKMERDFRNTVSSSEIDFIGERKSVFFAGLTSEGNLGRVLYYTKGRDDTLTREEQEYARAVSSKIKKGKGAVRKLIPVKDIEFTYYYYDPEDKEYKWKDSWKVEDDEKVLNEKEADRENEIPLGVRVELTFKEGAKDVTLTKTVLIPVGQRGPLVRGDG
jgi:hypothetical protein